jgi:prepilin-type N-terminal cleavage/methylation domain-containing protein
MVALRKQPDEAGFTLIELLIVIIVIGILAAIVITTYAAKITECEP